MNLAAVTLLNQKGQLSRIRRIRILASALGPALNRQAGFTAARPATKSRLGGQAINAAVINDGTLLTGALNGQLSGSARTLRLIHDALTQLVETRRSGNGQSAVNVGMVDLALSMNGNRSRVAESSESRRGGGAAA